MKNRLSKILALSGIASRRKSDELIFEKRVKVNGKTIVEPFFRVDPEIDQILVDNKPIGKEEKKLHFLLNKPKKYICSSQRRGEEKLVIDLFDDLPHRLYTVGRLDKESEGLILVTNDGAFSNAVIHPSFGHTQEYLVKVKQEIFSDHLEKISSGIFHEGKRIKPKKVIKMRKGTLKITTSEGIKHEVRLLCEAAGLLVFSLKRIRLGPMHLGSLPIGKYRPLTQKEIAYFKEEKEEKS